MSGEDHRRRAAQVGGRQAVSPDGPPDPFEDIAAPPLRTTPRPVRPAAPQPDPAPIAPAAVDHGAPADPSPLPEHASAIPPKPAAAPAPRQPAAPAPASGARQLRTAFVAGVVIAAGIVALALALRPPSDPAGPTPTELGSGPVPAPAAPAVPAAPAAPTPALRVSVTPVADTRVELRVKASFPAARRAALEAAVTAAGYGGIQVSLTGNSIERGRIEFFHPADRAAAEALSRSLAPLTGQPLGVHDMSSATIDPVPGHLTVWIPD